MCLKTLDVQRQNTSVITPGLITQLTGSFLREALVQGRLVVRQDVLQGEAYVCSELELCMCTRAGNTSMCILLPFLNHFSPLPSCPIPQTWKDRAHLAHTAARREVRLVGGKQLPARRRPSLLSLAHMPMCICHLEEFVSNFQLCRRVGWLSFLWDDGESVAFGSPSYKGLDGGKTVLCLGIAVQFAEYMVKYVLQLLQDVGSALPKKK